MRKTDEKRLKVKESRKLTGSYCLARMYVKHLTSTGSVQVDYIFTHTNHSPGLQEVKTIPLPKSVHDEIRQKSSQGVSLERIQKGELYCYT